MFAPEAVEPVVDVLARLAGPGWALGVAVGTGRIAIPIRPRGVTVTGIELSRRWLRAFDQKLVRLNFLS